MSGRSSPRKHSLSPPLPAEFTIPPSPARRQTPSPPHPVSQCERDSGDTNSAGNASPLLGPIIPKIKLRDFDSEVQSREVSLSSTTSTEPPTLPMTNSLKPNNQPKPLETKAQPDDGDDELTSFLAPTRKEALQALEGDTASLVDALRSFVNALRDMSAELNSLREEQNHEGGADHSRGPELCAIARSELEQMKMLIDKLKAPRDEALSFAQAGLGTATGSDRAAIGGADWTNLSCRQRILLLRREMDSSRSSVERAEPKEKSEEESGRLKDLLTAVVEQEANKEFLQKVKGWEEGVTKLETEFGVLLL